MRSNVRRIGTVLGCLAWLVLSALGAWGQTPASPKILTKAARFKLPVVIDDDVRVKLLELRLYAKGPEDSWVRTETAAPTAPHFIFKVERDGEYQFTFVTVDRSGRTHPSNVDDYPPHRIVVVDTTPPELGAKVVTGMNGDAFLQVIVNDANPDPTTTQVSYPTRDGWQSIAPVQPDRPGVYRLPAAVEQAGTVRVQATDATGNVATRDFRTKGLLTQTKPPAPPVPTPTESVVKQEPKPEPNVPPVANLARGETSKPAEPEKLKPLEPLEPLGAKPVPPAEEPASAPVVANKPAEGLGKEPLAPQPLTKIPTAPPSVGTPAASATTNFINSAWCNLNYVFENADPANPPKPEFWATRDGGRNWQKLADEANGRSPARLELPGEGLYGIAIRTGQNGQAPTSTDRPDCWVEVDTSKPFANLLEPTLGKDTEAGTLLISWTAQDKNLREDAITVSYAIRPDGPWLNVLRNHKNEGAYRWIMPTGLGSHVYLRMEAADLANNVGRAELRKPVPLQVVQPKVRVISVAPAN